MTKCGKISFSWRLPRRRERNRSLLGHRCPKVCSSYSLPMMAKSFCLFAEEVAALNALFKGAHYPPPQLHTTLRPANRGPCTEITQLHYGLGDVYETSPPARDRLSTLVTAERTARWRIFLEDETRTTALSEVHRLCRIEKIKSIKVSVDDGHDQISRSPGLQGMRFLFQSRNCK